MRWGALLVVFCLAAPARADEKQTGAILASLRMHDGTPVVDARFLLQGGKGVKPQIARTDDRGRAVFHTLKPGTYRISLEDGGRFALPERSSRCQKVRVGAGQVVEVDLRTTRGGEIRGIVRWDPENARPRVRMSYRRLDDEGVWRPPNRSTASVRGHEAHAPRLEPGRYEVLIRARGRPALVAGYLVRAGETAQFRLRFKPAAPRGLTVRIDRMDVPADARPERVQLSGIGATNRRSVAHGVLRWNEDARMSLLDDLPPGDYLLILRDRKMARRVTLKGGARERLRLTAPIAPAGGKHELSVRVTKAGGRAADRVPVCVRAVDDTSGWMRFAECYPTHAWFKQLTPGTYEVHAFDGVFGVTHGFKVSPSSRKIEVKGDHTKCVLPVEVVR